MKHKPKDIQYCERLFQSFYEIGSILCFTIRRAL